MNSVGRLHTTLYNKETVYGAWKLWVGGEWGAPNGVGQ